MLGAKTLDSVLTAVEALLYRLYVLPGEVKAVQASTPKRPPPKGPAKRSGEQERMAAAQDVRQQLILARSIPALVHFVNGEARHPRFLADPVYDVPVHGTGDGLVDGFGHMVAVGVEIGVASSVKWYERANSGWR